MLNTLLFPFGNHDWVSADIVVGMTKKSMLCWFQELPYPVALYKLPCPMSLCFMPHVFLGIVYIIMLEMHITIYKHPLGDLVIMLEVSPKNKIGLICLLKSVKLLFYLSSFKDQLPCSQFRPLSQRNSAPIPQASVLNNVTIWHTVPEPLLSAPNKVGSMGR